MAWLTNIQITPLTNFGGRWELPTPNPRYNYPVSALGPKKQTAIGCEANGNPFGGDGAIRRQP